MKPVYVEVITKVLTTYDHCYRRELIFEQVGLNKKFHRRDVNEYPEEAKEEFLRLSQWIRDLAKLYKHRILFKVIDAQSPMGLFKSLRHGAWKYPAFIVEGDNKYVGWDTKRPEALIDRHL
jgi:hypothetical protein